MQMERLPVKPLLMHKLTVVVCVVRDTVPLTRWSQLPCPSLMTSAKPMLRAKPRGKAACQHHRSSREKKANMAASLLQRCECAWWCEPLEATTHNARRTQDGRHLDDPFVHCRQRAVVPFPSPLSRKAHGSCPFWCNCAPVRPSANMIWYWLPMLVLVPPTIPRPAVGPEKGENLPTCPPGAPQLNIERRVMVLCSSNDPPR